MSKPGVTVGDSCRWRSHLAYAEAGNRDRIRYGYALSPVVPELATLTLLGLGVVGLASRLRRRRI